MPTQPSGQAPFPATGTSVAQMAGESGLHRHHGRSGGEMWWVQPAASSAVANSTASLSAVSCASNDASVKLPTYWM